MDKLEDLEKLEAIAGHIESSSESEDSFDEGEHEQNDDGRIREEIQFVDVRQAAQNETVDTADESDALGSCNIENDILGQSDNEINAEIAKARKEIGDNDEGVIITRKPKVTTDQHNDKLSELFLSVKRVVNIEMEEEEQDSDEADDTDFPTFLSNIDPGPSTTKGRVVFDMTDEENEDEMVDDLEIEHSDDTDQQYARLSQHTDSTQEEEEEDEGDEQVEEEEEEDDDEEDEDDDDDDDEELEPDFESLEYANTNYKDYLKQVLTDLTKELENNRKRQQEIELLLQDKESRLNKMSSRGGDGRHVSVARKALTVFGYPYFKDEQMYYPPHNKDTLTKRTVKELDNWIEYPRAWSINERAKLMDACRTEARYKRLHYLYDEREVLQRQLKAIGIADTQKEMLEDALVQVNHFIRVGINIPDIELFADRDQQFDWPKISKDLNSMHGPVECELQWRNVVHPSINKSPFTPQEDELLKQFAEATDCREWDAIAQEMGLGRTAIACFTRFMQKHVPNKNLKSWTRREDGRLIRLIHHTRVNFYIPWSKIHYYMPGRTKDQCNQRFMNCLREGIKGGVWTEAEEWLLIAGQTLYNGNSNRVSEILPTRSNMQIHNHWNNYMKGEFKEWTNQEDILLLESVKKYGIRNWAAVADVFKDESRNRARCRHRFEAIFKVFQKSPALRLDRLVGLETNKRASKRRVKAYESFEKKFDSWVQRMHIQPVLSSDPIINIDLNAKTTLPFGIEVENRIFSKFIRHLQTLLPSTRPLKLLQLPTKNFRRFPDENIDSLANRPKKPSVNIKTIANKLRRRMTTKRRPKRIKSQPIKTEYSKTRKPKATPKSIMDYNLSRLFRAGLLARPGRYKIHHSEHHIAALSITAKNLDAILDFSSVKMNIDEDKIDHFPRDEQPILESFRFNSDIVDTPAPQPETTSKTRPKKNYRANKRRNNSDESLSPIKETDEFTKLVNMMPPNKATMYMLRGTLLHADYTAQLASCIEPDLYYSIIQKNSMLNNHKVIRLGITNPEISLRSKAGNSMFTPLRTAKDNQIEVNEDQIEADKKLVERIAKLLYVPSKMSLHIPDKPEDVFDDSDGNLSELEDEEEVGVDVPIRHQESEDSSPTRATLKLRKLTSMLEEPLNLSLDHNIPSVMSICSEFGNPNTPATRTYSRKRKANPNKPIEPLKVSFGQLISQDRQRKEPRKMSDILPGNSNQAPDNPNQPQDLSSTSQVAYPTLTFPAPRPIDLPRKSNNIRPLLPQITVANLMLPLPRINLPLLQPVQVQQSSPMLGNFGFVQQTRPVLKLPIPRLPQRQPQPQRVVYRQTRPQPTPDLPQDLTLRK